MTGPAMQRRMGLQALLAITAGLALPLPARAGGQIEEPLADSVRMPLADPVLLPLADPAPRVGAGAPSRGRVAAR